MEAAWPWRKHLKHRPFHSGKEAAGGNRRVVGLVGEVKKRYVGGVDGGETGLEGGGDCFGWVMVDTGFNGGAETT